MKRATIILLLLAVSSSASAEPEIRGTPDDLHRFLRPHERTVVITGEAEEKAYSDRAIVDLAITTEDKMLSKSLELNSKLRETIELSLTKTGISEENIRSSKFSSSPQYGWFGKKPDRYEVINHMAITITDASHLQAIASIADSKDEVELVGTIFEHSEKDEYREKVKDKAIDEVLKQKELYEKRLGVKLIPMGFEVEQLGLRGPGQTREHYTLEEIVVTAPRRHGSRRRNPEPEKQLARAAPSFDEIVYNAMATVEFKLDSAVD